MELTRAQLLERIKLLEELAMAKLVVERLPATHCETRPVLVELRRYVGRQR
jgi:hypothetical protein